MEIRELATSLLKAITIKQITQNDYLIVSRAEFEDGKPYDIHLMQDSSGNRILTDKKKTLQYLDEYFDLNSKDVQSSIKAIVENCGFRVYQNALICKLRPDDDISERYFEFISCMNQLSNMFVFFDKPEDEE